MAETYPASVSTFKVIGRLARGIIDSSDSGQAPDMIPVAKAKVTFVPGLTPPIFRVPNGSDSVTIFQESIEATTNSQGYLVTSDTESLEGVVLPFGGDPDITPTGWSWFVTIEVGGNFPPRKFSIMGSAGGVINLGNVVPVPANPGSSALEWQFIVDEVNELLDETKAARDDAVAALESLDPALYVPRSTVQIGIDTDGVPYFSNALSFAEARPVLIDTDGVPYVTV